MEGRSIEKARKIISYVVDKTKPTVLRYQEKFSDLDRVFIRRGYEQGGFELFKLTPLLEAQGIFSIDKIGSILDTYAGEKKYNRQEQGSLQSIFYQDAKSGLYGLEGTKFYECVEGFLERRIGNPGAFFWLKLWQMVVCLNHLKTNYNASFVFYLRKKYAEFRKVASISDGQLLSIGTEEWGRFKREQKPWAELLGIGENVFDFIVGDVAEFEFASDSYKLDSANSYFLKVTGLQKLVYPDFSRESVVAFLRKLELPFALRQINAAIYTYCSRTEARGYGFCRSAAKCRDCGVNDVCERAIE